MPDFSDPKDFKRLIGSVEWSEKKLGEFRTDFKDVLREFAGFHYGEDAADGPRPINLIQVGATIYHRKISITDPQGMVTTRYRELLSSAEDFRLGLNHTIDAIGVEDAVNETGLGAMFGGIGAVKVGIDGDTLDPFVEPILFEDLILDLSAKSWRQLGYIGHRYQMPVEWVKDNEEFDAAIRARASEGRSGPFGANAQDQKAATLSIGTGFVEQYKPMCELIDLYLPAEKVMVTYLADNPTAPLLVKEWDGPPFSPYGPFRVVKFITLPGNIMPIAMVQFWRDVHEIINILANKTFEQAEAQKDLTLVPNSHEADGTAITKASNGDAIGVNEPSSVVQRSFGGANQMNLGMIMWLKSLFSFVSGGAPMLGGMEPGSDTVGQDTMLLQSAGTQVESMQHEMLAFTREIIRDVGWWIWTDKTGYVDLQRQIPGSQRSVTYRWDIRRKKGDFFQFNFDVEPYSVARRTPQQRLENLMQWWERFVVRAMPGMEQQGMGIDYEYLFKLAAEYSGEHEFAHMITYANGEQYPGSGPRSSGSPGMPGGGNPNKPNGKYERTNKSPGRTFEQEFMTKMLNEGGRQQQAQGA